MTPNETKMARIAVAGRYAERHAIKKILTDSKLDDLPVEITASWMDCTEEYDRDLTDEQAMERADQNYDEIFAADILLYFPSWWSGTELSQIARWSPGRLIDYGMALACGLDIIIVGTPEPSIYFRGATVCTPETLREAVKTLMEQER